MDFVNPLFVARWKLVNSSPKWESPKHLDFGIIALNAISLLEADYGKDAYFTQKVDAKWEKIREAFFGEVIPEGWNG